MPVHRPPQKPSTRKLTDPVAPTPPSAITPSAWPTMAVSTREYTCCKRSPNSTGTANCQIREIGFPTVRSCVIAAHLLFVADTRYIIFFKLSIQFCAHPTNFCYHFVHNGHKLCCRVAVRSRQSFFMLSLQFVLIFFSVISDSCSMLKAQKQKTHTHRKDARKGDFQYV